MRKALGAADRDGSPSAGVAENTLSVSISGSSVEPHDNSALRPVTKCLQSSNRSLVAKGGIPCCWKSKKKNKLAL